MFAFGLSFVWVHSVKNGAGGGRWGRDWSHVIRGFNAINRLLFVQICITKGERTIGTEEYFLEKVKLFFTSAPKLWLNSYPLNSREERYSTVLCYCFPRNIWGSSTPLSYPWGCPAALSFQLKKHCQINEAPECRLYCRLYTLSRYCRGKPGLICIFSVLDT